MRFLEEKGIGYRTPWALVPIVPAAVVFDLNTGSASVRPDGASGYAAALAASATHIAEGSVGAGTGSTVGKWAGAEYSMSGGFGISSLEKDGILVCAAAVVNALGDIVDERGDVLAGARTGGGTWCCEADPLRVISRNSESSNTVLVALLTNAVLSKVDANRVSMRAHDGMARAVKPAHTSYDGDTVFCLASGEAESDIDLVSEMGAQATAMAIRRSVTVSGRG
jgi:L-aminopeptidase/D-esterase-like protein